MVLCFRNDSQKYVFKYYFIFLFVWCLCKLKILQWILVLIGSYTSISWTSQTWNTWNWISSWNVFSKSTSLYDLKKGNNLNKGFGLAETVYTDFGAYRIFESINTGNWAWIWYTWNWWDWWNLSAYLLKPKSQPN